LATLVVVLVLVLTTTTFEVKLERFKRDMVVVGHKTVAEMAVLILEVEEVPLQMALTLDKLETAMAVQVLLF
jgi:hypothetical protein